MKLISDTYKEQNRLLHESKKKFGQRGHRHLPKVEELRKKYDCESVLDYGCGKADLSKHASFKVQNYDPGVPEYDINPEPADLIVCTDVLEHVERELLSNVLIHIDSLMKKAGFFVIATRKDTSKTLPNGENPHRLIYPANWWVNKLSEYFPIVSSKNIENKEVECIVLKR